ncbi:Ig-like domain-containing protein [Asticcacaulis sp. AC402]|uniref:Ig-like domain-containing protein n=1 Tax=Asticcacaulis sp. AC402 TaxID=1282361 RepID=UPI0003FC5EE2|nr:Ig-like domain-containing protein [Asticcacaulis sp. AC402]
MAAAVDAEGDALTYTLTGGADVALFAVDAATGTLSFLAAPNFEAPGDAGGNNVYEVTIRVSDGVHTADVAVAVTVTDVVEAPPGPITLSAQLNNDSGHSDSDGITNDAALKGQITDLLPFHQLTLSHDGTPGVTANISTSIGADGRFTLSQTAIETALGTTLDEGDHAFTLTYRDSVGQSKTTQVTLDLDQTAPTLGASGLAATSDTGTAGDLTTGAMRVDVVGSGEALTTVRGEVGGATREALVNAAGNFKLADLALGEGANTILLTLSDAAGNSSQTTLVITQAAEGGTDPVLYWHSILMQLIVREALTPGFATRAMATQSLAVYDAVAAIDGTAPFMVAAEAAPGANAAAAVAYASFETLSYLFPRQVTFLEATLATALTGLTGPAVVAGRALGEQIGEMVVALRNADGWDDYLRVEGGDTPGQWSPTEPMYAPAETPQFADLTPFALSSPDQFRGDGPPALTSEEYAAALNELIAIGGAESTERTADQKLMARFWQAGGGTETPAGMWNLIAAQVAAAEGNSLSANARLFAMLNVAAADAGIAAWDTKFAYEYWRPVEAVRDAEYDGNALTDDVDDWRPLLISPAHPEYVSGHSTYSAAAAGILTAVFGEDYAFTTGSSSTPGVTRSFDSFEDAAEEAGRSRIYGGIHFEFSNQEGQEIGRAVAQNTLNAFLSPQDRTPPVIALARDSGAVVAGDLTLEGQALDPLSGLAGLTARIDGGDPLSLTTDAQGRFVLPLNSLIDGAHSVLLTAVDAIGNSTTVSFDFTRDAVAPVITFTGFSDGADLTAGARLTGTADPTGSDLVQLSYSVDDGATAPLAFNPDSGAFDRPFNLNALAAGDHELTVTARDSAGNVTTQTLDFTLTTVTPFTIVSLTPGDGAQQVGVTQRPQITFSRPVDPDTLTSANFYAEDSSGAKVPARIVLAEDNHTAYLFFDEALKGSETFTVRLDGDSIRSADNQVLDGNDDGTAGGDWASSFETVSTEAVAGTTLSGFIVGPGNDLKPMTFDDFRAGPDGTPYTADDVFLERLAGVKVYIIGREYEAVFTDATGSFTLTEVPAGNVKVVIDGRTATNAPAGAFYPEMVMDVNIRPGQANTLMDAMGLGGTEEQLAHLGRGEAYLPRLSNDILQAVSATETTEVTLKPSGSYGLSAEQADQLKLVIQPGSLVDENGDPVTNAMVGVSTVPPELVRDMLPPGVLEHTFDITIQAPGSAVFTEPAQLTFPNVFNAAPGTQLNFLSFDHTTGRLVIEGTATVSADGLTVVTDPGTGITKPGWHGLTPPGGNGCAGGPPLEPEEVDPDAEVLPTEYTTLPLYNHNGEGGIRFKREWKAPDELPDTPPDPNDNGECDTPAPDLDDQEQPWINVKIEIVGALADFAKKAGNLDLVNQEFTLRAGTNAERGFAFSMKTFEEMLGAGGIKNIDLNKLYGSKIIITETVQDADGNQTISTEEIFASRFVDATDDNHIDGKTAFTKVVADGAGGEYRSNGLEKIGYLPTIELADGSHFYNATASGQLWFDPTTTGASSNVWTDSLIVKNPDDGTEAGRVALEGEATAGQYFYVDKATIVSAFEAIMTGTNANVDYTRVTAAERKLFDNLEDDGTTAKPNERDDLAQAVVDAVKAFYTPFAKGIKYGSQPLTADIGIVFSTHANGAEKVSGLYGTSSRAGGVDNVFSEAFRQLATDANANTYNKAETAFRLDNLMNLTFNGNLGADGYVDVHPDSHPELWNLLSEADPRAAFVRMLAETAAHEYGHTLSLAHSYKEFTDAMGAPFTRQTGPGNTLDLMMGHAGRPPSRLGGSLEFRTQTSTALLMSADLKYTLAQSQTIASYFIANIITEGGFSAEVDIEEPEAVHYLIEGPRLGLFNVSTELAVFGEIEFGTAIADGDASTGNDQLISLYNYGSEAVTIDDLELNNSAFKVSGFVPGMTISPGDVAGIILTFDPSGVGAAFGELVITSNDATAQSTVELSGVAQSPTPYLTVINEGNNLGGVNDGTTVGDSEIFTLRNDGAQPLVISAIALGANAAQFALTGIPADLATNPITLDYGETFSFGVSVTGAEAGLMHAPIVITSNDATRPTIEIGAAATGFEGRHYFDWGNDYISVDINGDTLRLKSDDQGRFEVFLPAETDYRVTVFDPVSGLVATGTGVTAAAGRGTDLTSSLVFRPSTAQDSDFDGLVDDIEHTIGSSLVNGDTNADGISDFNAVKLGLDPTAGFVTTTGVLASIDLGAQVNELTIYRQNDVTYAAVAMGTDGIAVVDLSDPFTPVRAGGLDLAGTATDVDVDPQLFLAAVATGSGGIRIVDLADPAAPVVIASVTENVSHVEVRDGVIFAGVGSALNAYDLTTGELITSLDYSSDGGVKAMVRDGAMLYVLTTTGDLMVIESFEDALIEHGSLDISGQSWFSGIVSNKLFAANGVLYVPAEAGFTAGYATIDVSDQDAPVLISGPDDPAIVGADIALNGSGLGVAVGASGGVFGAMGIDVVRTGDATDTGDFVTRFTLNSRPTAVSIGSGFAYVGDDAGNFHVVNFQAFDSAGIAPVITLMSLPVDVDPLTAGRQVQEGQTVSLGVGISDDVQVRQVEILINGTPVEADVTYPWDIRANLPTIAGNGGDTTLTVQVRATDTGGNVALSEAIVIQLVPDTIAPSLLKVSLADGAKVGDLFRAVRFTFDEALSEVDADAFNLTGPGGETIVPTQVFLKDGGRTVQVTYPQLDLGDYDMSLDRSQVFDRAGNPFGTGADTRSFTVGQYSNVWIANGDGAWEDAANWSTGKVPGADDSVLINADGQATITVNADTVVGRVVSNETLIVREGLFEVVDGITANGRLVLEYNGTLDFGGVGQAATLVFDGGALTGAGDMAVTGLLDWKTGTYDGSGELRVAATGQAQLQYPTLHGTFVVDGVADFTESSHLAIGKVEWDGAQYVDVPGHIVVGDTGVLDLSRLDSTSISWATADDESSSLVNNGTIVKHTSESLSFGVGSDFVVTNAGVIQLTRGTLRFDDFDTSGGAVEVGVDAVLDLNGQTAFGPAGAVSGDGTVRVNGGRTVLDAGTVIDRLEVSGGVVELAGAATIGELILSNNARIEGAGDLTVTSHFDWIYGTLAGSGAVTIPADAAVTIGYGTLLRDMTVHGDATIKDGVGLTVGSYEWDGTQNVDYAVDLTIAATGQMTFEGDAYLYNYRTSSSATESRLINQGTLTKAGQDVAYLNYSGGLLVENTGTIDVLSGGMRVARLDGTGSVELAADTQLEVNDSSNLAAISGDGVLRVTGGTVVLNDGDVIDTLYVTGGTVDLAGDVTIANLILTGGTVTGAGDLTMTESFDWQGNAALAGTGLATVADGATLSVRHGTLMRNLDIAGDATLADEASLTIGSYVWDGTQYVDHAANVTIAASGSLAFEGDAYLYNYKAGSTPTQSSLVNNGTLTKTGPGTAHLTWSGALTVENTGTVTVSEGTLKVRDFANTGIIAVSEDSTLQVVDSSDLDGGGTLDSDGTLWITGGTVMVPDGTYDRVVVAGGTAIVSGAATIAELVVTSGEIRFNAATTVTDLTFSGGRVTGGGALEVTGELAWTGGAFGGAGALILGAAATATLGFDDPDSPSSQATLTLARTFNVSGDVVLENGLLYLGEQLWNGTGYDRIPGTVHIRPGATFDFAGGRADVSQHYLNSSGGVPLREQAIINDGTVIKSGGGVTTIGAGVDLSSTVFPGGFGAVLAPDGLIDIAATTPVSDFGSFTATELSANAGTIVTSGQTLTINAGDNLGTVTIDGGTVAVAGDATVASLIFKNGTLNGDGDLTVSTRLDWSGGTMSGTGKTVLAAAATAQFGLAEDGDNWNTYGMTLARAFDLSGDAVISRATLTLGGSGVAGTLTVTATGELAFDGPYSDIFGNYGLDNALVNSGALVKSGEGTTELRGDFAISGTGDFFVAGGEVSVEDSVRLTLSEATTYDVLYVSGVLELTADITVGRLVLSGSGRIEGAGDLTVTERFDWQNGTILGDGALILDDAAVMTVSGGRLWRDTSLAGQVTIADNTTFEIGGYETLSGVTTDHPADVTLTATGSLSFLGDATLSNYHASETSPASSLVNLGSITQTGGGVVNATGGTYWLGYLDLRNEGTFTLQDGTFRAGNFVNSGIFEIGNNSFEIFGETEFEDTDGVIRISQGRLVLNAGQVVDELIVSGSAVVELLSDVTIGRLTQSGGRIEGAGDLTVTGSFDWSGGTLGGDGILTVAADALFDISGGTLVRDATVAGEAVVRDNRSFSLGTYEHNGTEYVDFPATLTIAAGGTFTLEGDATVYANHLNAATVSAIVNDGSVIKTGEGVAYLPYTGNLTFDNNGRIDVLDGRLRVESLDNGGTVATAEGSVFEIVGDSSLVGGDLEIAGGVTVTSGRLTLQDGQVLDELIINGGVVELTGDVTVGRLQLNNGARIEGTGDLTVTQAFDWTNGAIRGAGTLTVAETAELTMQYASIGRDMVVAGQAEVNNGGSLTIGSYEYDGTQYVDYAGNLTIADSGMLTFLGYATLNHNRLNTTSPASSFVNNGTFVKQGTGQLSNGGPTLVNNGLIDIQEGVFLMGDLENHGELRTGDYGSLQNSGDAVLAADGSVSAGGDLAVVGGTLILGEGQAFDSLTVQYGRVELGGATQVNHLAIMGGEVTGTGAVSVSQNLDWRSGTFVSEGGLTLETGATGTWAGGTLGDDLTIAGTLLVNSNSYLAMGYAEFANSTTTYHAAQLVISPTGVLQLGGGTYVYDGLQFYSGAPDSQILNDGLLLKLGVEDVTLTGEIAVHNEGTVHVAQGTLALPELDGGGEVVVETGAELTVGGTPVTPTTAAAALFALAEDFGLPDADLLSAALSDAPVFDPGPEVGRLNAFSIAEKLGFVEARGFRFLSEFDAQTLDPVRPLAEAVLATHESTPHAAPVEPDLPGDPVQFDMRNAMPQLLDGLV